MIISTSLLTKGIRPEFNRAYQDINVYGLQPYAGAYTEIPSTANAEKYGWLGQLPTVREWIGPRQLKGLKDNNYTITNKDFEATIVADRNEVEDDQIAGIIPRVKDLARVAREFPHKLCSDLLKNGTSDLAYDGVAFFSDATGVRVNDNLIAGTGTSLAQVEADLATARSAMFKFVDDQGQPMGIEGNLVVCPPELEYTFRKIMQSSTAPGQSNSGVINPFQSMISGVVVDHRLTDANDWYLLSTKYAIRPLIIQVRKQPEFVSMDKSDDSNVFMQRELIWGVDFRMGYGYGLPQMAVKVTNT